jgi:predicted Zn-dependent protease
LLKKDPNSPDGLRLKGALALIDNKPAEAVDAIQRALRTSPDSEELQTDLADALLKDNRFEEGERAARDAIAKHPQYASPYELLYSFYAAKRREADIVTLLKLWMANDPNNSVPVLRLAGHYYRQQQAADAENLLSSLLQRRAGIPPAGPARGRFPRRCGQSGKSARRLSGGQSLDRAHAAVYQGRQANILAALGRRDEALKTLDAMLANDSKNQFARAGKAAILMQIGGAQNLNAAAVLAGDLAKEAPANARIQMLVGQAFAAKGDLTSATASFQQAAKADAGLITARLALSQMALLRKNYQAVLENAGAALAIDPGNPNARLFRVIGLTETGAYAQAKTEADQLARDTDNKGPAEKQLGIIALRQKNYQEAEREFQKAYREGDPNPSALAGLIGSYIGERPAGQGVTARRDRTQAIPSVERQRRAAHCDSPGGRQAGRGAFRTAETRGYESQLGSSPDSNR